MKIWVIGRGYPTPENKMWGVFEFEQAKLLARAGHEVTYLALTLSFFSRKDPRGLRIFETDGVTVCACSRRYFPGKLGLVWKGYEDRCWRTLIERALEISGQPEALHVHYPAMIGNVSEVEKLREQGVRLYATEHWSRVLQATLNDHETRRLKYYAESADKLFCVSESLLDAARRLVEVKAPTDVVPNIVSKMFFEKENCADDEPFTFLAVGRLVPLKQFDVIISTFKKEFAPNENVRLMIVGSGPERSRLENMTKGDARFAFLGALPLERVADYVASSHALVSFSRYETFAAPVAEAMACGKPVIVSDSSGVSSYVDDTLGCVVRSDDIKELSRAMRNLFLNYKSYHSEDIKKFAWEHFGDEAVLRQLESAYECVNSKGAGR